MTRIDQVWQFGRNDTVNVSLTPPLGKAIKAKSDSGLDDNASEVVREALRQSLMRAQENHWLVREAAIGFAQAESGQTVEARSQRHFSELVRARG